MNIDFGRDETKRILIRHHDLYEFPQEVIEVRLPPTDAILYQSEMSLQFSKLVGSESLVGDLSENPPKSSQVFSIALPLTLLHPKAFPLFIGTTWAVGSAIICRIALLFYSPIIRGLIIRALQSELTNQRISEARS